jgi:hypothetical protein
LGAGRGRVYGQQDRILDLDLRGGDIEVSLEILDDDIAAIFAFLVGIDAVRRSGTKFGYRPY